MCFARSAHCDRIARIQQELKQPTGAIVGALSRQGKTSDDRVRPALVNNWLISPPLRPQCPHSQGWCLGGHLLKLDTSRLKDSLRPTPRGTNLRQLVMPQRRARPLWRFLPTAGHFPAIKKRRPGRRFSKHCGLFKTTVNRRRIPCASPCDGTH
ncbi:hypothetical protein FHS30_000784 [Simiduia aestuariiviva]|uniref:Uncharacterized protein n=1 Tax=Simiduia aestuariiviva TaxID=1510459 RepID=A0A839UPZ4_9GAMM|nr:hypothetical protein [Simiduia aestuariiviva]